jgi:hypothetical protein
MSRQGETDHLATQVHRIEFEAAVRGELEQAAAILRGGRRMPLHLLSRIWMASGAIMFGAASVFVVWLALHRPA